MKTPRTIISSRDYDGIILDMLDDIVAAEQRAKALIDRLDAINKQPTLRVVDIDQYLWGLAAITAASFFAGTFMGYIIHFLVSGG